MHTHVNFLSPARFTSYVERDDAVILGGTLHAATFPELRHRLGKAAAGEDILHLTISLPEGMIAERETLLRAVEVDLRERGMPPGETIWCAVQHRDTSCVHIHAGVVCRTWSGARLTPWVSEQATQHISGVLAATFGLSPIPYFDPAAHPRLVPQLPKRRQQGRARSRLANALLSILGRDQPDSLEALNAAFKSNRYPWRVSERPNRKGVPSYHVHGDGFDGFLGSLGQALRPSAMRARFALAGLLRQIRPILQLRALAARLAEIDNLKKENPDEYARRLDTAGGGFPGGASARRTDDPHRPAAAVAAAPGPAQDALRPGRAGHDRAALSPDGTRLGGAEPDPEGKTGHRGDAPGPRGGDRGDQGRTRGSEAHEIRDRGDAPPHHADPHLTVGHWLGNICRSLEEGQRFGGLDWSSDRVEAIILDEMGQPVVVADEDAPGLE